MTKNIMRRNLTARYPSNICRALSASCTKWGSLVTKTGVHGEKKELNREQRAARVKNIKGFARFIITHCLFLSADDSHQMNKKKKKRKKHIS